LSELLGVQPEDLRRPTDLAETAQLVLLAEVPNVQPNLIDREEVFEPQVRPAALQLVRQVAQPGLIVSHLAAEQKLTQERYLIERPGTCPGVPLETPWEELDSPLALFL
jgi:hypothetical protein